MNKRLSLASIATYLANGYAAGGGFNATHGGGVVPCDTVYAQNYIKDYGKKFPYVWVRAQRANPATGDRGSASGLYYQQMKVDVAISIVCQRYAPGMVGATAENFANDLFDATTDLMKGYEVVGAQGTFNPFQLESTRDGMASESCITVDLVISATVLYRSP